MVALFESQVLMHMAFLVCNHQHDVKLAQQTHRILSAYAISALPDCDVTAIPNCEALPCSIFIPNSQTGIKWHAQRPILFSRIFLAMNAFWRQPTSSAKNELEYSQGCRNGGTYDGTMPWLCLLQLILWRVPWGTSSLVDYPKSHHIRKI